MARNRLATWLLLAGFLLALLPIALGLLRGLRWPVINAVFWAHAGPQPSRRELLVEDLLWGQGDVSRKLRTLVLDLLWGQGVDARLHTIQVIIGASVLVCVICVAYRHVGSVLALRVARARRVRPGEERLLAHTVDNLCIGAGLPRPRLYVIETAAANAFATGWDPAHASIVVTRGLLARLGRRELEAVLAHELSHIGNCDTRLATLAAIASWGLRLPLALFVEPVRLLFRVHPFTGLLAAIALLSGRNTGLGLTAPRAYAHSLELSDLVVLLVYFVVGLLIQRAIARQREYLADADAFLLTRAPGPLARALAKLAVPGGLPLRVNGAFSHLYVTDPFVGAAPWWDRVLSTHPPLETRLARLAEMGGSPGPSPVSAPEDDLLGDVPEGPADRGAPGSVHVLDGSGGPDLTLIGLTVAGAVGAVALLAMPSRSPLSLLLTIFLQIVVFTTALYVAHVHRIPDWTSDEVLGVGARPLDRIWVGILAVVAIIYHPLVDVGIVQASTSPGLALFPAGLLLVSLMWPAEFWGEESSVPEEAGLEVAVRESGATHPVPQPDSVDGSDYRPPGVG
jgi:heat shock protein HtpX